MKLRHTIDSLFVLNVAFWQEVSQIGSDDFMKQEVCLAYASGASERSTVLGWEVGHLSKRSDLLE
jgi:hypothetical protein